VAELCISYQKYCDTFSRAECARSDWRKARAHAIRYPVGETVYRCDVLFFDKGGLIHTQKFEISNLKYK
jgi:hypothetical protein